MKEAEIMSKQYQDFLEALAIGMKQQSGMKLVPEGTEGGCLAGEIQECHYQHEVVGGTEFLTYFLLEPGDRISASTTPTFVFRWNGEKWSVLPPAEPTELTAEDMAELFLSMPRQWKLASKS
jgi:hypothetical protein